MSDANTAPRVLMVFPKFYENSMWNFKEAMELQGARAPAPPLGLITLAAMLPPRWQVSLVNRNCEELSDDEIRAADLVMTGGMLPQEPDCLVVIDRCVALGTLVCVGGPAPTSTPEVYDKADFLVLGEAEGILDTFVAAWEAGERRGRFTAEKFKADVTTSPIPRFDLLTFSHYLYIGVQFSRGCPFTCEFCDIIELYGRAPRTKTTPQMLAELDRLYGLGYRGHVDFVDDNLIGNKKAIKLFLPHLIRWQEEHGYPFKFSTEASLNLADDEELLGMMRDANFFALFTGIETPDEATLIQTQKKQNTKRSIADSVHKLYEHGMFVTAGFIVGFDTEKDSISKAMSLCISQTGIPIAMVGLLFALPNTQLSRRLRKEGRLYENYAATTADQGDQCTQGINFVTLRPQRDVLGDYRDVLEEIYDPANFFDRVRVVARRVKRPKFAAQKLNWRHIAHDLWSLARVCWRMTVRRPELAKHFWSVFLETARHNPAALEAVVSNMVIYLHVYPFSRYVIREINGRIAELDAGRWVQPPVLAPEAEVSGKAAPVGKVVARAEVKHLAAVA
ncbi:B12-binding domain-containing radical SAM protein [Methylobacterium sp. J-026]|uniref:B12-binding domain-containing radical SAM protein n=1 Tax=Methylobacterium sp. J-026 TaxID=2836624 RepID=UPI001FBBA91C|nr:B12-binding domain-containing radical SAM protein [Methylobacterium sp. J-026]MCJ2135849.1 B12-binding domain-containing radical SAM protein [Methylobacterium sp. J-026]